MAGFASLSIAQSPALLTTGVEITSSNQRTSLNRTTGRLSSTIDMTLKNTGDRLVEPPLHAVLTFTPAGSSTLQGLTVSNATGGIGQGPYQTYYVDLSSSIGTGLAAGASLTFSFAFERPASSTISYAVTAYGLRNRDPTVATGGPYAGTQAAAIAFDASGSSDPDGDTLTFAWDFGDGATATGATPSHTFAATGLYTVTVTADDGRGAQAFRQLEIQVSPPGVFALGRTRTLDGNGHPLGGVAINETSPTGSRELSSDALSGFASLGNAPGLHNWRFSKDGFLTVFRQATLIQGQVKTVPFPWMPALNANRTTLSVLTPSTVASPSAQVTLAMPPEAFGQAESIAVTDLHGQSLPLPLPYGWSPLAAFHLDMPSESAVGIAASVKLLQSVAVSTSVAVARFDAEALAWKAEAILNGAGSDTLAVSLRKPGSYAVVIADSLPSGSPLAAVVGQGLPAGAAPVVDENITANGLVDPSVSPASLDPARVTAQASVTFTNNQPLASGAWFMGEVEEIYDLRDGQALKGPDYDATFFAYQLPGDADAATAAAHFPMRPRVLFSPEELSEANIRVDVSAATDNAGGVITSEGGVLSAAGLRLDVPAGAVAGPSAVGFRSLSTANLAGFLGGLTGVRAFDLNLPAVTEGTELTFSVTAKLAPNAQFVLARCVASGSESGLQPVLRLSSDAQGNVSRTEPATGARLAGVTGSGQYVLVQVDAAEALITGRVRKVGGSLLNGAVVRVSGEVWLSITDALGTFATLAKAGTPMVTGVDPADGNRGQATATLVDAAAHAAVEIQTVPTGPRVVATTPVADDTAAPVVTAITVEFSEPIKPGSFGSIGLRLRDVAAAADVPGALSLELSNKKASFFPTNPLKASADYQIIISTAIVDRQDLPLEGASTFAFRTAATVDRATSAQLVIYEPDAENVPQALLDQLVGYDPASDQSMVVSSGSPGTADPQVAVILVNETTGQTATVLSKVDGSFTNFLRADAEDFISAVFINKNGTRITIPASRQLFDDGRVGLYQQGGILEAESDGGPVQVIVKPGSVESRNVFAVNAIPFAELLALLGEVRPPGDGAVIGGLSIKAEGGALSEPVKVKFPASVEHLQLPPGSEANDAAHVLSVFREVNGVKVFQVVDDLVYRDGYLQTTSPPFPGFFPAPDGNTAIMNRVGLGPTVVLQGRAVSFGQGAPTIGGAPVEGAVVFVSGAATVLPSGSLNRGTMVAITDEEGAWALKVPVALKEELGYGLLGISTRFPGAYGRGAAIVPDGPFVGRITGRVVFHRGDTYLAPDTQKPRLFFAQSPPNARPNQQVVLSVLGTDDRTAPTVSLAVVNAINLDPAQSVNPQDVTLTLQNTQAVGTSTRLTYHATCKKPAAVWLSALANDGAGNVAHQDHTLQFDITEPPPVLAPNPADTRGPYVLNSRPVQRARGVSIFDPIELEFNERIDPGFLGNASTIFVLNPSAGVPVVELQPDGRTVSLRYPKLLTGLTYNLFVNADPLLRDLAGNPFDQEPGGMQDFHSVTFSIDAVFYDSQLATGNGSGAVGDRNRVFLLDRSIGNSPGQVRVWTRNASGQATPSGSIPVGPYPRDLFLIEDYSYNVRLNVERTSDLLVVIGGQVIIPGIEGQTEDAQPWIKVFEVENPAQAVPLVSAQIVSSISRVLAKLDWSPPMLGVLEIGADGQGVNLINLQGLIHAYNLPGSLRDEPGAGQPGVDLNGDGDYVDQGESIPRPSGVAPLVGWINGGWVGRVPLAAGDLRAIEDFSMTDGGQLIGAVLRKGVGGGAAYRTLLAAGDTLDPGVGELPLTGDPRRVLLLRGIALQNPSGGTTTIHNLALVTQAGLATLRVIDVTNPSIPSVLADVPIPVSSGDTLHTPLLASNGRVVVASSRDLLVIDPKYLLLPTTTAGLSPAVLGHIPGAGVVNRRFATDGAAFYAVAMGSKVRVATDNPLTANFSLGGLVFRDQTEVEDNGATTTYDREGRTSLMEIVSNDSSLMTISAVVNPNDQTPPQGFPRWEFRQAHTTTQVQFGVQSETDLAGFDSTKKQLIEAMTHVPGHGKAAALLALAGVAPDTYTFRCQDLTGTINVYPNLEVEGDLNSEFIKTKLSPVTDKVKEYVTARIPGAPSIDVKCEGKFKFKGKWVECAWSGQTFFGLKAEAAFDPLLGFEMKYPINVPPFVYLKLLGANAFLKLDMKIGVAGTAEKTMRLNQCAVFAGGAQLTGAAMFGVSFEITRWGVEASAIAQTGIAITGRWVPSAPVNAFTVTDLNVQNQGLQVHWELKFPPLDVEESGDGTLYPGGTMIRINELGLQP